jgi:hypothetical protein
VGSIPTPRLPLENLSVRTKHPIGIKVGSAYAELEAGFRARGAEIEKLKADRDYWEKMARTPAEGDPFADALALLREWGSAYDDPRFPKSDYGERIRLFLERVDRLALRRSE